LSARARRSDFVPDVTSPNGGGRNTKNLDVSDDCVGGLRKLTNVVAVASRGVDSNTGSKTDMFDILVSDNAR